MPAVVDFPGFREEWLTDVRSGRPGTIELGHRFARKLLTQWREVEDSSDDLVTCDGAGDGVAYLDRNDGDAEGAAGGEAHTRYLVQSKCGSAFRGTNTLLEEAAKAIATLSGERKKPNSLADDLRERLTNFRHTLSERDRIVLVFATDGALTGAQKSTLGSVRDVGRGKLGDGFDVESVSVATVDQRTLEQANAAAEPRVKLPVEGGGAGRVHAPHAIRPKRWR
jgi:hypothetical protein